MMLLSLNSILQRASELNKNGMNALLVTTAPGNNNNGGGNLAIESFTESIKLLRQAIVVQKQQQQSFDTSIKAGCCTGNSVHAAAAVGGGGGGAAACIDNNQSNVIPPIQLMKTFRSIQLPITEDKNDDLIFNHVFEIPDTILSFVPGQAETSSSASLGEESSSSAQEEVLVEFELRLYSCIVIYNFALAHHYLYPYDDRRSKAEALYKIALKLLDVDEEGSEAAYFVIAPIGLVVKSACINNLIQLFGPLSPPGSMLKLHYNNFLYQTSQFLVEMLQGEEEETSSGVIVVVAKGRRIPEDVHSLLKNLMFMISMSVQPFLVACAA